MVSTLKVLQINLGHCRAAQDLMFQVAKEMRADVVIVSEQYANCSADWYSDATGRAAIYVPSRDIAVTKRMVTGGDGWVWIEIGGRRIYSCYFSPNSPLPQYEEDIRRLEDDVRGAEGPVIVAGDFNASAAEWGSSFTNARGTLLCEVASGLHLHVANVGRSLTFRRGGSGSIIDVTFTDENTVGSLRNWRVLEDYSHSDHQYIAYELDDRAVPQPRRIDTNARGWNARKLDAPMLRLTVEQGAGEVTAAGSAADKTRVLCRLVSRACDSAMPRRARHSPKRQVYWWNDHIAGLRRACLASRRRAWRSGRDEELMERYRDARRELSKEIKASKQRCWAELCESVDRDAWGLPYKLVRQKLRKREADPYLSVPTNLQVVIDELFPEHDRRDVGAEAALAADETCPPFSPAELTAALRNVRGGKTPGPDEVPNEVVAEVATTFPDLVLGIFNACLEEGIFPDVWKRQQLVLIPKKTNPDGPTSYRPLCMLDGFGKLLERLILQRLQMHTESDTTGLSERQYGFRRCRSTIDAVSHVVGIVRSSWTGSVKASGHVAMVTLDIRNAFNSARWDLILKALREDFRVSRTLLRLLESYLDGRVLEHRSSSDGTLISKGLTSGVPQGSVLGPTLWNAMYDGLLRVEMPAGATVVAFADDVAVLVTSRTPEGLQVAGEEALRRTKRWLDGAGLKLAVQKTEAVLFTRKRRLALPTLTLDGYRVPFSDSVRYLGVWLDKKLNFSTHIDKAAAKASITTGQLARLMPNIGGPKTSRRKLLHEVVHSTMLYAAPVWAEALRTEYQRKKLARVQRRSAVRVACAYRTVSEEAVLAIAASPPVDLLALERTATYNGEKPSIAKARTAAEWQRKWDSAAKGRWTYRVIGDLKPWRERKHGQLCYHVTQLLTGHGCFGVYLNRIRKENSERCHHCDCTKDDAEHTIFHCPAWNSDREVLRASLGTDRLTVDRMVPSMLSDPTHWSAWTTFAKSVLGVKEEDERTRRRAARPDPP